MSGAIRDWPFFDTSHRTFAAAFQPWVAQHLRGFETDEGGDGRAAREIFVQLGRANWLHPTVAVAGGAGEGRVDLRRICLMREILGYSSAMADVAFSEPWLAALPIALYGTDAQKQSALDAYAAGRGLPAFALSEPEAGSDVASI